MLWRPSACRSRPGRDPREELPKPIFRRDILKLEDLKEDMILKGTVRNVVDFGAFVDIGIKQDGLVHISELGYKFIKSPLEINQKIINLKIKKLLNSENRFKNKIIN